MGSVTKHYGWNVVNGPELAFGGTCVVESIPVVGNDFRPSSCEKTVN